jgi:hypothetical protein
MHFKIYERRVNLFRLFTAFLFLFLLPTHAFSESNVNYPWMKKYKKNYLMNYGGLFSFEFVEQRGRSGHQSMFEMLRPPVAGERFLSQVIITGSATDVELYFIGENGKKVSSQIKFVHSENSSQFYFSGTFPKHSFFAAISINFKNSKSRQWFLSPQRFVPRIDLTSYKFRMDPNQQSDWTGHSEKMPTEWICQPGQGLAHAFKPEEPSERHSFYIRHSMPFGIEEDKQCYLEVLQEKGNFSIGEFVTTDQYMTQSECARFKSLLTLFGSRTRAGNSFAFLDSSCQGQEKSAFLRLRIGFSKKPDFNFPDAPMAKKESIPKKAVVNQVRLEELCSIQDGFLPYHKTPIDLSLENSGRALIRFKDKISAVFQAPDCKIVARYSKTDFGDRTISRNGTSLYVKRRSYGKKNGKENKEKFGLEKSNGEVVVLTPPKDFDQTNSEFPKVSMDGNAVIWKQKFVTKIGRGTRIQFGYLIQDLKGKVIREIRFPLGELKKTPKIYSFDMKQKIFYAFLNNKGLAVFDLEGKLLEGPVNMPGVNLYSSNPPAKFFSGKKRSWVGWNKGVKFRPTDHPFLIWETDFGKGRFDFEDQGEISSVSVSGDGRFIAVTHNGKGDVLMGRRDLFLSLISTGNGEKIYTKLIGKGNQPGMLEHQVAFLKNDFIAYNRIKTEKHWVATDGVVLMKIKY